MFEHPPSSCSRHASAWSPTPTRRWVGLSAMALLGLSTFVSTLGAANSVECLTEPIGDVEMTAAVPGVVSVIHHAEGKFVEAGTVILELESKAEQLDIDRRTVHVETLKAEFERSETLLNRTSSISREEVDKKRSEFRIAAIELELAREALAKRRITAPFSGVVTLLPVEVGEYCQPPRVLVRLVDARQFYAVAHIEPAAAGTIALDKPVVLEVRQPERVRFEGRIVFVSPVVDPSSGLLRIKAQFENREMRLRPGVAGQLELP